MANLVNIVPLGRYNENLYPDSKIDYTVIGSAGSSITNSAFSANEDTSLRFSASSTDATVIDFNESITVQSNGSYGFSFYLWKFNPLFEWQVVLKVFKNGILNQTLSTDLTNTSSGFIDGKWNVYGKSFNLVASDVITFRLEVSTGNVGNVLYVSAPKFELLNKCFSLPSYYTYPKNHYITNSNTYVDRKTIGWASYIDTLHTSVSPQTITEGATPVLLTNNAGSVNSTQLPDGVIELYDQSTTKITPVQENDFNSVDIMFMVKNSVTNGFFTLYIDIPTLGHRFEQLFVCPKTAGTAMGVNYSFHHFVSSAFAENGGIIYIVANSGNLQIYDKQYRFAKLINAK